VISGYNFRQNPHVLYQFSENLLVDTVLAPNARRASMAACPCLNAF
jgi:hypothetical protein